MISPSTYYRLIYHRSIKLLELVTFTLIILAGFIIILSVIEYLWKKYVTDVIVIGNGPFTRHFHLLLERAGLRSQLILPDREYQLGFPIDETPWTVYSVPLITSRPLAQEIIFPSPSDQELDQLADQYNLPLDEVKSAWQEIVKLSKIYPQHHLFSDYVEKIGTQQRELYSYFLRGNQDKYRRSRVVSIQQEPHLSKVCLDQEILYSRITCLVEVSQENIFQEYYDLDHPLQGRLSQIYISPPTDSLDPNPRIGSFFGLENISFCYYRSEDGGKTCFSTDVDVNFDSTSGRYYLEGSSSSLAEKLGFDNLPPCHPRISHLFFSWKQRDKSPIILDRLNILSSSPERDLLIVMKALTKMLNNNSSTN